MAKSEKKVDYKNLNEKQFKKEFKKSDNFVAAIFKPAEEGDFENFEEGDEALALAVKCNSVQLRRLIQKLELVLVKQELFELLRSI